jgi:hypothetical protein
MPDRVPSRRHLELLSQRAGLVMAYTLECAGSFSSSDASEADIHRAFDDDRIGGEFIILTAPDGGYIQASGDGDGPYSLQYREATGIITPRRIRRSNRCARRSFNSSAGTRRGARAGHGRWSVEPAASPSSFSSVYRSWDCWWRSSRSRTREGHKDSSFDHVPPDPFMSPRRRRCRRAEN